MGMRIEERKYYTSSRDYHIHSGEGM